MRFETQQKRGMRAALAVLLVALCVALPGVAFADDQPSQAAQSDQATTQQTQQAQQEMPAAAAVIPEAEPAEEPAATGATATAATVAEATTQEVDTTTASSGGGSSGATATGVAEPGGTQEAAATTPTPTNHNIALDTNGGSGAAVLLSATRIQGTQTTLPTAAEITRDGYRLVGWSTDPTTSNPEYTPGQAVTIEEQGKDVTLHAVWARIATVRIMSAAGEGAIMSAAASNANGSFSPANAGITWNYQNSTSTLTIRLNNSQNPDLNWTSTNLPWSNRINKTDVMHVVFAGTDGQGIRPTSLAGWFQGYTSLVDVDGTGLDTSKCTNFSYMFEGCTALVSVTGSGDWTMPGTGITFVSMFENCTALQTVEMDSWSTSGVVESRRANMFNNCKSLRTLSMTSAMDLTGACFDDTHITSRIATAGTWRGMRKSSAEGADPKKLQAVTGDLNTAGVVADLLTRKASGDTALITYQFFFEAYFASSAETTGGAGNVKWSFDEDSKTLTIQAASSEGMLDITEHTTLSTDGEGNVTITTTLPWARSVDVSTIRSVVVKAEDQSGVPCKIKPHNLNAWFYEEYNDLRSFDGSGFDVSNVTSFASMFEKCSYLNTVNLAGSAKLGFLTS